MSAQNEITMIDIRILDNLYNGVNDRYMSTAKTLSHEAERLKGLLLPLDKMLEAVKRVIDDFAVPLPLGQFLCLTDILGEMKDGGEPLQGEAFIIKEMKERFGQVAFPHQSPLEKSPGSWLFEYLTNQRVFGGEESLPEKGANQQEGIGQLRVLLQRLYESGKDGEISISDEMLGRMMTEQGTSIAEIMQGLPEKGANQQEGMGQLRVLLQRLHESGKDGEISISDEMLGRMMTEQGASIAEIMQGLPKKGANQQEGMGQLRVLLQRLHESSKDGEISISDEMLGRMMTEQGTSAECHSCEGRNPEGMLGRMMTEQGTSIAEIMQGLPEKGANQQEGMGQLKVLLQRLQISGKDGEISISDEMLGRMMTEQKTSIAEIMQGLPKKGANQQEGMSQLRVLLQRLHESSKDGEISISDEMLGRILTERGNSQVNNTFNVQVYSEELKNKQEMNTLAEKINKILIDQARRYGIEVR